MDKKQQYFFLKVIDKNLNVNLLKREGMDFKQMAGMIEDTIKQGLIKIDNNKILLSEEGKSVLSTLNEEFKNRIKDKWIDKEHTSKIEKLDTDFIFLPRPFDLLF